LGILYQEKSGNPDSCSSTFFSYVQKLRPEKSKDILSLFLPENVSTSDLLFAIIFHSHAAFLTENNL
jgi:hypothetical protein